ncbi:hypothetical protein POL68_34580 [Stigmatella sp. ncwal1]|uniref:Uncharacterized protein n=1 Tax=Stigmatella ashevillensis TaxID=2995309 RepID=A0ABT5DJA4_9BACT|nr:hypothetical protein [Stigmatella ashevillena]MDC0713644.1 hypothetical protein [Stigmatella ashevillena]
MPPTCAADGKATYVTVGCTPNTAPPYFIGEGCPAPVPVQVTRMNDIDQTAQTVNQLMQHNIGTNYPGSVWQNYTSDFSFVFTLARGLPPSPVQRSGKLTAKQKAAVAHTATMRRILR